MTAITERGRWWVAAIEKRGWCVVPDVFAPDEVARLRAALDGVFERETALAARRGWVNETCRVAYMLPAKSPDLLAACTHPGLLRVVRAVLGDDCALAALNGMTPTPGGRGQRMHRDQEAPGARGLVVHLNAVVALDRFTAANGATRIVSGSHRDENVDHAEAQATATTVEAAPGSVVAYAGTAVHASGANRTPSPRRALHAFFRRRWAIPHWDLAASLPPETSEHLTGEQRWVLGLDDGPKRYDVRRDTITR